MASNKIEQDILRIFFWQSLDMTLDMTPQNIIKYTFYKKLIFFLILRPNPVTLTGYSMLSEIAPVMGDNLGLQG